MNLAVVITKPGLDDAVRLGPFVGAVPAECVAGGLRSAAAIAAAAGTTVEVVASDPTRPHVPLAVPTDPGSLGELMEQLPAGGGDGRDFPDLRAVATGLYRPDEEIAEHLPATRSPRCHTTTAGAALVWTECGRELDPETARRRPVAGATRSQATFAGEPARAPPGRDGLD
jgi:hypothetical protein